MIPFGGLLKSKTWPHYARLGVLCPSPHLSKLKTGGNTKPRHIARVLLLAEEEGFEPPVPYGTMVFKTTAFDHSATPLK